MAWFPEMELSDRSESFRIVFYGLDNPPGIENPVKIGRLRGATKRDRRTNERTKWAITL